MLVLTWEELAVAISAGGGKLQLSGLEMASTIRHDVNIRGYGLKGESQGCARPDAPVVHETKTYSLPGFDDTE